MSWCGKSGGRGWWEGERVGFEGEGRGGVRAREVDALNVHGMFWFSTSQAEFIQFLKKRIDTERHSLVGGVYVCVWEGGASCPAPPWCSCWC
jgi:hypothetical protein